MTGPATAYIAGELRAQKARLGWSFDELAERSNVPRSTAERALKGQSVLAIETLITLAVAMGLDLGALISHAAEQSGGRSDPGS